MSEILRVTWCVTPLHPPRVWRHCRQCNSRTPFCCSGKFRVNAQKKRIDVWLIYRCGACGETWNLPIMERLPIGGIPLEEFQAITANDTSHALRHAFDLRRLKHHSDRVEQIAEVAIGKHLKSGSQAAATLLEIEIILGLPCRLRLDGLLSRELGVPRHLLSGLHETGALAVSPENPKALRMPIIDGQKICIDLKSAVASSASIRKGAAP